MPYVGHATRALVHSSTKRCHTKRPDPKNLLVWTGRNPAEVGVRAPTNECVDLVVCWRGCRESLHEIVETHEKVYDVLLSACSTE